MFFVITVFSLSILKFYQVSFLILLIVFIHTYLLCWRDYNCMRIPIAPQIKISLDVCKLNIYTKWHLSLADHSHDQELLFSQIQYNFLICIPINQTTTIFQLKYFSTKVISSAVSVNVTIHLPTVWPMLGHRLRRWPNIGQTLVRCIVFAGTWLYTAVPRQRGVTVYLRVLGQFECNQLPGLLLTSFA